MARDKRGRFVSLPVSEDDVRQLYLQEKRSQSDIAEIFGVSRMVIVRRMRLGHIPARTYSDSQRLKDNSGRIRKGQHLSSSTELKKGLMPKSRKVFQTKAYFERLYWGESLSTIEIGKRLGVASKNVQRWMHKFNTPMRTLSDARKLACLSGRAKIYPPTKPELRFLGMCEKHRLPFRYVGNGSFWIDRLNPDFVNEEAQVAVEIFGRYWHDPEINSKVNPASIGIIRETIFQKHGWKLIVLWDDELEDEACVLKKLATEGGSVFGPGITCQPFNEVLDKYGERP